MIPCIWLLFATAHENALRPCLYSAVAQGKKATFEGGGVRVQVLVSNTRNSTRVRYS